MTARHATMPEGFVRWVVNPSGFGGSWKVCAENHPSGAAKPFWLDDPTAPDLLAERDSLKAALSKTLSEREELREEVTCLRSAASEMAEALRVVSRRSRPWNRKDCDTVQAVADAALAKVVQP